MTTAFSIPVVFLYQQRTLWGKTALGTGFRAGNSTLQIQLPADASVMQQMLAQGIEFLPPM